MESEERVTGSALQEQRTWGNGDPSLQAIYIGLQAAKEPGQLIEGASRDEQWWLKRKERSTTTPH